MADPRDPTRIVYPAPFLLWTALSIFVLNLGSRRQIRFDLNTPTMLGNLNRLAGTKVEQIEHPGTLGYLCMRMPETELPLLLQRMVRHLIRMKALDAWRFQGYCLVVIDGTGYLTFRERHCTHCLERKAGDKTVYYYHPVLEAKLVAANGLAISLVSEFIENTDPNATKQDCELKAFYRLAPKLKAAFPQLRIALLLDSLFLGAPVLSICKAYDWRTVITFKEGSAPAVWQEYQALKSLSPENRLVRVDPEKGRQEWAWVEGIEHDETHRGNVVQCREPVPEGKEKCFVWWTDFPLSKETVIPVGNDAGRLRWKIENEGFNAQKNGGFNLEHMYAKNWNAAKNFYVLLQIGHLFHQLMEKGSLIKKTVGKKVKEAFGSIKNFTRRLFESLRYWLLPEDPWAAHPTDRIQIRLDSS